MNYLISDTIMESLKNAQSLQEVEILLGAIAPRNSIEVLNAKPTKEDYENHLLNMRDTLMVNFTWRLYKDNAIFFNRLYTDLAAVANIIHEEGVLK